MLAMVLMLSIAPAYAEDDGPEAVPEDEYGNLLPDDDRLLIQAGDANTDVLMVQVRLQELCYYSGSLTGHMGEATKAAVKAFQQDFNLPVTGTVNTQTYNLLLNAVYRPLSYGSSGDDVQRLQLRLAQMGYFTGAISGNYLGRTTDAVSAFQQKMGEEVTGKADVATQELLFSKDARTSSESALQSKVTATPSPDGATPAPTVAFKKKLSKGSTGSEVTKVQQRLTDLCYYAGAINGSYQQQTANAVKRFQEQNGLDADGVVGVSTWDALFNSSTIVPPDATAAPTPEVTPKPTPSFWILVDVKNQVTTVYGKDANGDYTVVVRQMLCSTGTTSNPSDVGDWTLSGRKATWCYFPKWGSHARYWTKINDSIAFHSVIYSKPDLMALNVSSYNKLGSRASHGCIRLTVADAKWIYDNVPAGTVVHITEKMEADPELRASLKLPAMNKSNMMPYTTPEPTAEPNYIAGAQPPMPLKEMRKNSSGEDVYWLQKKLAALGYYKGKCSGTYLDGTAAAVRAFQKDHGMNQSGVATVELLNLLYQDELATPTPAPTETPAPTARTITLTNATETFAPTVTPQP